MEINIGYAEALGKLLSECEAAGIEIEQITAHLEGFIVLFKGVSGDAVCHSGSYGRLNGYWETIGMPWDDDDVSVHSSECLVKMLKALKDGEDWKQYEE